MGDGAEAQGRTQGEQQGRGDDAAARSPLPPSPRLPVSPSPIPLAPRPAAPPDDPEPADISLAIPARERELLRPELAALTERVADPALRGGYAALLAEVESGTVTGATVRQLENLLELGLQTGRFRRQHGPIEAQALQRLYSKTPRGAAIAAALAGVNDALATLEGQAIDKLSLTAKGPGEYDLLIDTERRHLTIAITSGGVRLASVEAAL